MIRQRRRFTASTLGRESSKRLAVLLLGSISALLGLAQVLSRAGWPSNHDAVSFAYRTRIYSEALRHGDLLPIWAADGNFGLGSAIPLFYHKLFFVVTGALHPITGSIEASACAALFLFSLVGIYGLHRICLELDLDFVPSLAIAISFPHLNYSVTDWLVRGAMAEYAAMALATWLVWWCIRLVVRREFSLAIAPILLLVFLAHSLVAYYGVFAVGIATLLYRLRASEPWRRTLGRASASAAIFLVLAAPIFVPMALVRPHTNLGHFSEFFPTEQFRAISHYVFDREYDWGGEVLTHTVQLDGFYLAGVLVAAALLLALRFRAGSAEPDGGAAHSNVDAFDDRPPLELIAALLAFYGLLQLPLSGFFYVFVPGADMIQFPWRLLAYLTILLVALFALLVRRVGRWDGRIAVALALAASLGTIGINLTRERSGPWSPSENLEDPRPIHWPEYWPWWTNDDGRAVPGGSRRLRGWAKAGASAVEGGPCTSSEKAVDRYLEKAFEINCATPATIALPVAYSGLETVLLQKASGASRLATERVPDDPRVRVSIPEGRQRIRILLPTLARALSRPGAATLQ